MREVSYEPRHFDPNRPSGPELTTGNIAKISNAVAILLADIGDLNKRLDRIEKAAAPTRPLLIPEARP
jgi:hypothetical protein